MIFREVQELNGEASMLNDIGAGLDAVWGSDATHVWAGGGSAFGGGPPEMVQYGL